jgi:hypothetical protein
MLLEIFPGLVVLRPLQRPFTSRTAMGQPILGGFLFCSPPFGLLARVAKIDDVAHVKLGGNQMLLQRATLAPIWSGIATPHADTETRQFRVFEVLAIATGCVAIPLTPDNTRMLEKKNNVGTTMSSRRS